MTAFAAIVPVEHMDAANAALEEQGFGPTNFSVPAYTTAAPTYALLHCWGIPDFRAAVEALEHVTVQLATVPPDEENEEPGYTTEPRETTIAVAEKVGATWIGAAKALAGTVTPGLYVRDEVLYWVSQGYNTAQHPDPDTAPGVKRARVPGRVDPWQAPETPAEAYKVENPFTKKPDEAAKDDKKWKVVAGDQQGNNLNPPAPQAGWELEE